MFWNKKKKDAGDKVVGELDCLAHANGAAMGDVRPHRPEDVVAGREQVGVPAPPRDLVLLLRRSLPVAPA